MRDWRSRNVRSIIADTLQNTGQVLLTYRDIREANPNWSEQMIEDYASLKSDVFTVSIVGDTNTSIIDSGNGNILAQLNEINNRLGSGDPLTSDETGFTVDSTKLTVDMTEA